MAPEEKHMSMQPCSLPSSKDHGHSQKRNSNKFVRPREATAWRSPVDRFCMKLSWHRSAAPLINLDPPISIRETGDLLRLSRGLVTHIQGPSSDHSQWSSAKIAFDGCTQYILLVTRIHTAVHKCQDTCCISTESNIWYRLTTFRCFQFKLLNRVKFVGVLQICKVCQNYFTQSRGPNTCKRQCTRTPVTLQVGLSQLLVLVARTREKHEYRKLHTDVWQATWWRALNHRRPLTPFRHFSTVYPSGLEIDASLCATLANRGDSLATHLSKIVPRRLCCRSTEHESSSRFVFSLRGCLGTAEGDWQIVSPAVHQEKSNFLQVCGSVDESCLQSDLECSRRDGSCRFCGINGDLNG